VPVILGSPTHPGVARPGDGRVIVKRRDHPAHPLAIRGVIGEIISHNSVALAVLY
jgi:hypothetical protein